MITRNDDNIDKDEMMMIKMKRSNDDDDRYCYVR